LRAIPHLEIIRIGTKIPVVLPQRITPSLVRMLKKYHPLFMSVHTNHPRELTVEVRDALGRLADAGIPLGNQSVLLKQVNDDVTVMRALVQKLLICRVKPYYVYQCDPISGSSHLRTSVAKGLEVMEGLRERGLHALRVRWNDAAEITGYVRDLSGMPKLLRSDGGGYANTAFVLGLTNWALAGNVKLEAWLHLQTTSQNHRPIPRDSELVVESAIADLFEKKGHEFVDLDVVAYLIETREPAMSARLRAIYRLRES